MSLIYGFLIIDLIGTFLLLLPISSKAPGAANILTCLFTATTSVTVTGLVTVDTLEHWTLFGQAIILTLIFIGGLGFMTGAAFLIILVGQELRLQNRLIVREGLGWGQLGDITTLVRNIVVFAVAIQFIAIIVLWCTGHSSATSGRASNSGKRCGSRFSMAFRPSTMPE